MKIIYNVTGMTEHTNQSTDSLITDRRGGKNKVVAALLAIFLGGIGIHKFYLGKVGWGIMYLIFCWTWIPMFVSFIEAIIYLTMSDKEFEAKYS